MGEETSRELRVGRAIQHPNVCRIFDFGEADGQNSCRWRSRTAAPSARAEGVGRRAPAGPIAWPTRAPRSTASPPLHAAGIIHRDLKPDNILRMEDGRLVVSDLAWRPTQRPRPATTIMIGTPSYMAPEVVTGDLRDQSRGRLGAGRGPPPRSCSGRILSVVCEFSMEVSKGRARPTLWWNAE